MKENDYGILEEFSFDDYLLTDWFIDIKKRDVIELYEKGWTEEDINNLFHHMSKYIRIFNNESDGIREKFLNKEYKTIVDLGSCFGDFSFIVKEYCDKIISIDAVEKPLSKQKELFEKDNKINFINAVVSDREKEEILNIDNKLYRSYINSAHFMLDKPKDEEIAIKKHIKTETLDNLLKNEERVDLIKIDIEGSEINALKGSKEIIKKYKPTFLILLHDKAKFLIGSIKKCFGDDYDVKYNELEMIIEINENENLKSLWEYVICSPKEKTQ